MHLPETLPSSKSRPVSRDLARRSGFHAAACSLAFVAVTISTAQAVNRTWNVASGDFNDGANWNAAFTAPWPTVDVAIISNGGTATMSGGTATLLESWVGQNASGTGTGTLLQTGGTLVFTDGLVVGRQGTAVGFFTMTGGTTTVRNLRLGGGPAPVTSSGTVSVSGVGTVFNTGVGATGAVVGIGAAGTGSFTLDQSAVWNATNSNVFVGGDNNPSGVTSTSLGGSGTLNVTGGAAMNLTAVNLAVGRNGNGSGTLNVTAGGTITMTNSGASDAILNLGNVNATSTIPTGANPPNSTLTLAGPGSAVTVPRVLMGLGNVTVNLNGGTFTAGSFTKGTGNATIHFNGTTVVASVGSANYFNNVPVSSLDLQAGGLKFDTNDHFVTVPQGFSGSGSLTKQGFGTLILQAGGGYTGDTIVTGGTLELGSNTGLHDSSTVRLSEGALLNLTFTGSDTVAGLVIDGMPQAAGTWGGEGSGADHESPLITGEGRLLVANVTSSPFETWAGSQGLSGADALPGADPDGDGYTNLAEFILGGQPNPVNAGANSNALGAEVAAGTGTHVFSFRRSQVATTEPGLEIVYQYGSDLVGWTTAIHGTDGVSIETIPGGYGTGIDRVNITIPDTITADQKRFVRLRGILP